MKVAGYLNLAADFTHNFTDGLAIGELTLDSIALWKQRFCGFVLVQYFVQILTKFVVIIQSTVICVADRLLPQKTYRYWKACFMKTLILVPKM